MKMTGKIVLGITLVGALYFATLSSASPPGQSRDEVEKTFAVAKRLIYEQEWARALPVLEGLVNDYPAHFRLQESLYWLAYSLNQSAGKENGAPDARNRAVTHLERLLRSFPEGRWARQANALLVEISGELARSGLKQFSRRLQEELRSTDDLDIKLLALDSLMNTDSGLAREKLRQMVQSDRPAELRRMALSILMRHTPGEAAEEMVSIIRNDTVAEMRFFALGQLLTLDSKKGLKELNRIMDSEVDMKLKTRMLPLYLLTENRKGGEFLVRIAKDTGQPESIRAGAAFLLPHAEAADSVTLIERLFAGFSLPASRAKLATALGIIQSADAAAALIRLYKREKDTAVKKSIIQALGITQQDAAQRFLQDLISQ